MSLSGLGLRTVIYHVGELEQAKAWYSEAFGITPYFDNPGYVGFNVAGYELGLMPGGEESGSDAAAKTANVRAYWGVEDVPGEMERLVEMGAQLEEPATNVGGPIIVGAVKDPWGNLIGLIHNPLFKLD